LVCYTHAHTSIAISGHASALFLSWRRMGEGTVLGLLVDGWTCRFPTYPVSNVAFKLIAWKLQNVHWMENKYKYILFLLLLVFYFSSVWRRATAQTGSCKSDRLVCSSYAHRLYVCMCVCAGARARGSIRKIGMHCEIWGFHNDVEDPSLLGCYVRRPESACIQSICFVSSLFSSLMTIQIKFFCCPTVVPAPIVRTLVVSRDSLVYCLLLELFVLCYQPSCQVWFHLAVIFGSVGVRSLLQRWKQMIISRWRTPLV